MSDGLPGLVQTASSAPVPIWPVTPDSLESFRNALPEPARAALAVAQFQAKAGQVAMLPAGPDGRAGVAAGIGAPQGRWDWAQVAAALPASTYAIAGALPGAEATQAAIAWALGSYRFRVSRDAALPVACLVLPESADAAAVARCAGAVTAARDLVNQPANRLGPEELSAAVEAIAKRHGARFRSTVGPALLADGYPAIHAVGRSSHRAPRLLDLCWGRPDAPKVTLVGKGVCFDTGGLNIKSMADMRQMKRDMGGAAVAFAVASMVMDAGLPVRLRLLVPAVDNVVAEDAFRPGDILDTRSGLKVEIANTDCEGRLVLADALAEADAEAPDLVIDFGTLTGSARVALGGEIGALFSDDADLAARLQAISIEEEDPLWTLPLWQPYRSRVQSQVADLLNMADGAYAGAITAAVFLQAFVRQARAWVHLDISAWNDRARPGRPSGGEATGARAIFALLAERYAA
ncbi:leucyl aminopeptidase family protein [Falsiroseomonas oryzae]|uniref:leucyl aminopeptidase family protein n=1 Tax=Falsiroseomonas oryzae TaxID=2766473 RepID=UPI0022EA7191|nr:leucyl aminopeptidase family protein [Roseomonas sp. MO-31]